MVELSNREYLPLTDDEIRRNVPTRPGVYILAVRLANGVFKTFFSTQSENLYRSLRQISGSNDASLPPLIREHKERFLCYFNYMVIYDNEYRGQIEKLLTQTFDPASRLMLVQCN